jgi:ZIP family zinc transporter
MDEAWDRGGFLPVGGGFLAGALVYTGLNYWLANRGARHRKRSCDEEREKQAKAHPDNGMALALGALLDGIPESIVIGVSLLAGGAVGYVAVIAVFLSNLPEGLSSAAGMRKEGKTALYTFSLWTGIAVISGVAALVGYIAFDGVDPAAVAAVQAIAAGAILAMIVDTMVPEAFEGTHDFAGLIAVSGFLAAFVLSHMAS